MIRARHRAGWSIGDVGGVGPDGSRPWPARGTRERVIRAEAGSRALA